MSGEELRTVKVLLRSLVAASEKVPTVRTLTQDYRKVRGHILISKFGCNDMLSFLNKYCRDILELQGPGKNPKVTQVFTHQQRNEGCNIKLNTKSSEPQVKNKLYVKAESSQNSTKFDRPKKSELSKEEKKELKKFKNEICELVLTIPEEVTCGNLALLYRDRYKRDLNFKQFGFASILAVVEALGGVHMIRSSDDNDWVLKVGPAPPPERNVTPPPPGPKDFMRFTDTILNISMDKIIRGDKFAVIVTQIYSPSHFWVTQVGHSKAVFDLTDVMNEYYEKGYGKDEQLMPEDIRVGYYCSAKYMNDWNRAVIVRILDSKMVKVRHVDYGTVVPVNIDDLKPLRRVWSDLPIQLIRARLHGIAPVGKAYAWPQGTSKYFLEMVENLQYTAHVKAIDSKEIWVDLTINSTTDVFDIGTRLFRTGHADPASLSVLDEPPPYHRPSFEELENGLALNYGEIFQYLRTNIPLTSVDAYRYYVMGVGNPPVQWIDACLIGACLIGAKATTSHDTDTGTVAQAPALLQKKKRMSTPLEWLVPLPPQQLELSTAEIEFYCILCEMDACAASRYMLRLISTVTQGTPRGRPHSHPVPPGHEKNRIPTHDSHVLGPDWTKYSVNQ